MPDFASILETVERDAATRDVRRHANSMRLTSFPIETTTQPAPDRHAARSAYAAQSASHGPADTPQPQTIDALRRDIAAARDVRRLHQLRRRAARALHPDRGGDGAELAECNALIDAALRSSRKRT